VVTTHTDVSSTLLKIAGVTKQLDGVAMPLGKAEVDSFGNSKRHEHAAVEYWGYVCATFFTRPLLYPILCLS